MKKSTLLRYIPIILFTGVLAIILIYGIRDRDQMNITGDIIFSHKSGFYEEEFRLQLLTDTEGEIFYTLDGSMPDRNSYRYQEPILISDASEKPNVYSMRTDLAVGFMMDKVEQYTDSNPRYAAPDYNIDKANIVRAIVYYDNGECSDVETATYFVGFDNKAGYEGLNVVSIVTEPENLFDYEDGIYVTGETFDNYWYTVESGEVVPGGSWWRWPANYLNRGKEWEREAECQFFDTKRNLILNQSCGIRTRGGASRGFYPRGLNLYARTEYDGNPYFSQMLFTDSDLYPASVTLTQGGGEYESRLKDYLFSVLAEDLNFCTMDFEPYAMFLNGEYWGVYWLTERYDERYLSYHYNIYEDNVIIVKNGELEAGDDEGIELYTEMITTCSTLDMTNQENYDKVCELIDIESYLDYFAAMLHAARHGDWPNGNCALWRTKQTENGEYGDNKWRWMAFDLNSGGMTAPQLGLDVIELAMNDDAMFCNLMKNDTFRAALIERIKYLDKTVFNSEIANKEIDKFVELMEIPMQVNHKRFYSEDRMDEFYENVESVRYFYNNQSKYMNEILKKYEK